MGRSTRSYCVSPVSVKRKMFGLIVLRPSPVCTFTSTGPLACGGVTTRNRVLLSDRGVTVTSPNVTSVGQGAKQAKFGGTERLSPVIVTSVRPLYEPRGGWPWGI